MLEDFDISYFKNRKPPSDNSLKTFNEISNLSKIKINKDFINKNDDVETEFKNVVGDDSDIDILIEQSVPHIKKLKNYFNRPRPKDLAKNFGLKLENVELKSMDTPSYPSGHSAQGFLIGDYLKNKYPEKTKELDKVANDISDSRNVARAHYKSDSDFGRELGLAMSKHIRNKK